MAMAAETSPAERSARRSIIDCDIHNEPAKIEALFPYLPEHWREHITQSLFKGPVDHIYPPNAPTAARPGSRRTAPAGSDLGLLRAQALDEPGVEIGILNCAYADRQHPQPRRGRRAGQRRQRLADRRVAGQGAAPARLDRRAESSIPELAAREIDRVGGHPGFVQVFLPVAHAASATATASTTRSGRRSRATTWSPASTSAARPATRRRRPAGPPTTSRSTPAMAQVFATQLTSIISEGVFDRFPSLRVALIESGFTWLPAHMWRFDKEWKNLRRLVPWVKRAPSEYIREHMRLTIQPLDAPPDAAAPARGRSSSSARTRCCCTPATTRTCTHADPSDDAAAGTCRSRWRARSAARTPARCTGCSMMPSSVDDVV